MRRVLDIIEAYSRVVERQMSHPAHVLSESEKQRLLAEETYRLEVRRSLEALAPKKSRAEKIWDKLNSPFVLWLLSW